MNATMLQQFIDLRGAIGTIGAMLAKGQEYRVLGAHCPADLLVAAIPSADSRQRFPEGTPAAPPSATKASKHALLGWSKVRG